MNPSPRFVVPLKDAEAGYDAAFRRGTRAGMRRAAQLLRERRRRNVGFSVSVELTNITPWTGAKSPSVREKP